MVTNRQLKDFENSLVDRYGCLSLQLSHNGKWLTEINIDKIIINETDRNGGIGSAIMQEICKFADMNFAKLCLYVDTIYGGQSERLFQFYQKFGFNKIPNTDVNFMIRYPVEIGSRIY
jgi:predicted GNAT family N-acyltransferase